MRLSTRPCRFRTVLHLLAGLAIAVPGGSAPAFADDFAAATSGNWNTPGTWIPIGVPGASDNVYIGSTYPTGAALSATVVLTQDHQAQNVTLGYGTGASGVLDLGDFKLTAGALYLGSSGGTGSVARDNGYFDVGSLYLSGSTLVMSGSDLTNWLDLNSSSAVTTAAAGNVTGYGGSTLTLGADLEVGGWVDMWGAGSKIEAQGKNITAGSLYLSDGAEINDRGALTVGYLSVNSQPFDLAAADVVSGLDLYNGAAVTTAAAGNVTGNVSVYGGSTLTLGADLEVGGWVSMSGAGSKIDAQGKNITAGSLYLSDGAEINDRGVLTVGYLSVWGQPFDLASADVVFNLNLDNGAAVTTAVTGNVTDYVGVYGGSTLTLGADLAVTGSVSMSGAGSKIDAQGKNITAGSLYLDGGGSNDVQLLNDGAITVGAWSQVNGAQVEVSGGDDTADTLTLSANSDLRVKSSATGFTIASSWEGSLNIDETSTLTLELDGTQPGWVFRWANPEGGDHIAALNDLIAQDRIVFDVFNGGEFLISSQSGYTYIIQPVPEPSLALLVAAPVAVGWCLRRRRRAAGGV
jgi:hypothetical protein